MKSTASARIGVRGCSHGSENQVKCRTVRWNIGLWRTRVRTALSTRHRAVSGFVHHIMAWDREIRPLDETVVTPEGLGPPLSSLRVSTPSLMLRSVLEFQDGRGVRENFITSDGPEDHSGLLTSLCENSGNRASRSGLADGSAQKAAENAGSLIKISAFECASWLRGGELRSRLRKNPLADARGSVLKFSHSLLRARLL